MVLWQLCPSGELLYMIIDKIDLAKDNRVKKELLDEIQKMYGFMIYRKGLPVDRQNLDQVAWDLLWKSIALFCDLQTDDTIDVNNLPEVKEKIHDITLEVAYNITRLLNDQGLRDHKFGQK